MRCKICNNERNNVQFEMREMMLGYKDLFSYFQCSKCDCLQIKEFPKNILKYYPENYYSFQPIVRNRNKIIKNIINLRNKYAVFNRGFIGNILYLIFPEPILKSLSLIPLNEQSAILDVGCGNGQILYSLREIGFKNILGIDPYIIKDFRYVNGLTILKKSIFDVNTKWDLIMFHHSFEHIDNPQEILSMVYRLLKPGGICMITIPKIPSYAWEHYGVNWVQLDPPRHFFIHSTESIKILARNTNFKLHNIYNNSTALQFWGSEQYKKDIPLFSNKSYETNPDNSIFSKKEIVNFNRHTKQLNKINKGDQAVFYLIKQ